MHQQLPHRVSVLYVQERGVGECFSHGELPGRVELQEPDLQVLQCRPGQDSQWHAPRQCLLQHGHVQLDL